MNGGELRAGIETLWPGHGGQTRAAETFGVSSRRIRAYLSDEEAVPGWLANDMRALLVQFPDGVRNIDPRTTINLLLGGMVRNGLSSGNASAAILGAAISAARQHIDSRELRDLLVEYL